MTTILDPLTVGRHRLPSRVVFGPIATNLADGRALSKRHVAFYRERAAGGCGLIVTEQASVHDSDWPYERCPDAEQAGPGWRAVAEACAPFGTVVVAGLSHAGGQSTSAFSQRELWAPSDEPDVNTREVPKIMEQDDIDAVVAGFATAARRAVDCGLAGVEVNAGQFSLVRQFLSGLTNRRDDRYGEDRSLLARQVLVAVRRAVGPDRLVGLRLSCDELAPWAGITPESAADLAPQLAGEIDYLTVVRGGIFSVAETRPTGHHEPGFNLELAGRIRATLDPGVAVFAQGSIVSVAMADEGLARGWFDGAEMTRAQLADAALVASARRSEPARPCVLCNQLCNVRDNRNPIISCIADPRCGHETTDLREPAAAPVAVDPTSRPVDRPDVVVIGGGPAGLEAARVAGRRGLAVRLVEAGPTVGGMARTVAAGPGHHRLADLVAWLEADARRHGVDIRCNETMTAEDVARLDGRVILATGGTAGPRTFSVDADAVIVDAAAVLAAAAAGSLEDVVAGEQVAIWDPIGGPAAVAVAELVAAVRPKVALITPDAIAGTMLSLTGDLAGANVRLQQAGVTIEKYQRLRHAGPTTIETEHVFTGARSTLAADVVIDASARYPNDQLWDRTGRSLPRVGDAVAPRTVAEAIREGRAAALALDGQPIEARAGTERNGVET